MIPSEMKTLGEVCEFHNGKAHEKAISEDGEYKVVNSKFISSEGKSFKLTDHAMFPLFEGDICFVMSDVPNGKTLAKCFLVDADDTYSLNQRICAIKTSCFDLKFLFYQLNRHPYLLSFNNGENQTNLRKADILNCPLWMPPISEQQRIVAILDQAFADIEKARTNAVQNLKNARELFDSYLQQVFSQHDEGWETSKLKDITLKIGSGATPRGGKDAYKVEGTPLIRSMNVHDRSFIEKNLAFIDDQQAAKLNNVIVEKGDVLLNITGASVARCCVAHEDFLPARVNQHVSIIRVDKAVVSPEFLNFMLTSKFYKDQLLGIGEAGSTRQAITKAQIENFTVGYPRQINDQINLLEGLFSLEEKTLKVQRVYEAKLKSLDELKKSILQKAFSGELAKSKGIAA